VPGIYRPRYPERTVLYRVLFHHFDQFIVEYEARFERKCGYFRPVIRGEWPDLLWPTLVSSVG
jgi:hypothetical protein